MNYKLILLCVLGLSLSACANNREASLMMDGLSVVVGGSGTGVSYNAQSHQKKEHAKHESSQSEEHQKKEEHDDHEDD